MPALGLLPLLEIIGLGVSAGSAAYGGYESAQGSGSGSTALQQAATNTAQQQQAQQQQQAIKANLSNAQEQTGGALGNAGLTNLASLLAGYGGTSTGGANPSATASTASTSTTPGLQDALSQLQTGASSTNFSGGADQSAQPSGDLRFQLTNPFTA
jgi:hypothetical protein